jgi:hypothetical protein
VALCSCLISPCSGNYPHAFARVAILIRPRRRVLIAITFGKHAFARVDDINNHSHWLTCSVSVDEAHILPRNCGAIVAIRSQLRECNRMLHRATQAAAERLAVAVRLSGLLMAGTLSRLCHHYTTLPHESQALFPTIASLSLTIPSIAPQSPLIASFHTLCRICPALRFGRSPALRFGRYVCPSVPPCWYVSLPVSLCVCMHLVERDFWENQTKTKAKTKTDQDTRIAPLTAWSEK